MSEAVTTSSSHLMFNIPHYKQQFKCIWKKQAKQVFLKKFDFIYPLYISCDKKNSNSKSKINKKTYADGNLRLTGLYIKTKGRQGIALAKHFPERQMSQPALSIRLFSAAQRYFSRDIFFSKAKLLGGFHAKAAQ